MVVINYAKILFLGKVAYVVCDRQCCKAWGVNGRPRIELDKNDPDNFVYLADGELGDAPIDPRTYEGSDGKPLSPDEFPNKWCVRECERSIMLDAPLLPDFGQRIYNLSEGKVES